MSDQRATEEDLKEYVVGTHPLEKLIRVIICNILSHVYIPFVNFFHLTHPAPGVESGIVESWVSHHEGPVGTCPTLFTAEQSPPK